MKATVGQIIALTEGIYSDYYLKDHVRVLKEFDTVVVENEFIAVDVVPDENKYPERDRSDRFVAWLIREGYVEPTGEDVVELWLGDYDFRMEH